MELKSIIKKLHPLERIVLPVLDKCKTVEQIHQSTNLKDVEVMRALQWLSNKKIISVESIEYEVISLDTNGRKYLKEGLPEMRLLEKLNSKTLTLAQARAVVPKDEFDIALGSLKKKAAIFITREKDIVIKLMPQGKKMLDEGTLEEKFMASLPKRLDALAPEEKYAYENLKRRKSIIKKDVKKEKTVSLSDIGIKLLESKLEVEGVIDTLTSDIIKKGIWREKEIREYDVTINVPKIYGGKRHFVSQVIDYVRNIWIELGFKEVTGQLVQTSFWDLDALFVPQDHPARQMQDTFFIKDPELGKLPAELIKKVKAAHESGFTTGSKGWQSQWSEKIAKQNLMITHDTYLSAKVLANIKKEDLPVKTFQIMKVFRNETMDWKHIFEFYQVGGIVVDENVSFRHLLGYLRRFFKKMGFDDVRLRPAHFPYTEPSCEIEVLHPVKKEWIELGGSGIFRPELVKPLLGFECPVLAWGFGLERILTDYYNISDLRQIYSNDLKQLRESKIFMK